ncbi:MAG: AAA family ATPase, partial [Treponema sp.]|nr:AAA family ATPase [Treponema sp.]
MSLGYRTHKAEGKRTYHLISNVLDFPSRPCYDGAMNGLKLFPIGLQDFARIRRDGYYYVDKTDLIYKMVSTGSVYFLSR